MIAIIGLLIGVILGVVFDIKIPDRYSVYLSVAILACLDSVFGAVRATLSKTFKADIFISGFLGNSILAAALAYLGDKLGIPMYIAPIVVFGSRIFYNFSTIRRIIIEKIRKRSRGA